MPAGSARKTQSVLANHVKFHPGDVEGIQALRLQHRADKLADFIEAELAKAPPLSHAQRGRLAALLLPPRIGGGNAPAA